MFSSRLQLSLRCLENVVFVTQLTILSLPFSWSGDVFGKLMPAVQMRDRCSAADCYGSVGHEIRGLTRTSAGHHGIPESCTTLKKTLKVVKPCSCSTSSTLSWRRTSSTGSITFQMVWFCDFDLLILWPPISWKTQRLSFNPFLKNRFAMSFACLLQNILQSCCRHEIHREGLVVYRANLDWSCKILTDHNTWMSGEYLSARVLSGVLSEVLSEHRKIVKLP